MSRVTKKASRTSGPSIYITKLRVQMADDCHLDADRSAKNAGNSEMKNRSREHVVPHPKSVFEANDTSLPLPIRKDLVVYMKKDGSCLRRGCVEKIVKTVKTPGSGSDVVFTQLHSRSFAETTRSIQEVLLVDRPFFVGDTVVRFENAHMGEAREKERWCKDSQIGTVINVKCLADVLLLPSKIAVVQNVSLDSARPVGMLHPTFPTYGTNFVMYKQSIGYVKNDVTELTLRYRNSHTVIVREQSHDEDGVLIERKDPEDLWKDYVKGEVVGLTVEDASGEFARWPDGMPADFGKGKGCFSRGLRAFKVEKVRTVVINVEWIIGNGAEPSRIEGENISNVRPFETRVNTHFNAADRVLLKTNEQAKVICKKDYFKELTKKYRNKFEKREVLGSGDPVAGPTPKAPIEEADPAAKIARFDVTFDSETDTSPSDCAEESDSEEEGEKASDMKEMENHTASKGASIEDQQKTSPMSHADLKRMLRDSNHSAKELLKEEFVGEVLLTHTVVDVEWLDGSVSRDIPSYELSPKEVDFDQTNHMPGSIVSKKNADERLQNILFGIILATNDSERCCTVRWFTREDEITEDFVQVRDSKLSLFDIMEHETMMRGELGISVELDNTNGELRDRVIQVVENMKNGKQKFRFPDGTFKELWPDQVSWIRSIPPLHELPFGFHHGVPVLAVHQVGQQATEGVAEPVPFDPVAERNMLLDSFLRLMRADLGECDGMSVNRMRWFEAVFMLVRSHEVALFTEEMSWNNALLRDALEFAGYLNECRHATFSVGRMWAVREYRSGCGLSDRLSAWIEHKFKQVSEEGKDAMVKFCYRVHFLTRKYPRWFEDMEEHVSHKLFLAIWSYLDSQKNMKCELFGDKEPETMNELEQALGEKVTDYYSTSAWENMTRDDVVKMYEAGAKAVSRTENLSPDQLEREVRQLLYRPESDYFPEPDYLYPYDTYHPAVDRMMSRTRTELIDYDVIRVKKPINTWEAVCNGLDGELKDQYDQLISSAPHTLRIRVCGDTVAKMSDCFIWYHVLSQVLRTPDQLLPKTISIHPGLIAEDEDEEHWAAMSWIILMQAGIMSGPFYEYFPDNKKEYTYDHIERAVAINPVWSQFRLQLAAIYDLTVKADSSDLSARVNTFERFFPIKDILVAIRHALSGGDAKKPVCVVMESEVKEYTSGERSATVEQIKELKKWTGDTSIETTSQPEKFEVCSGGPRMHQFLDSSSSTSNTGRAFHAALRKEHRLLRDHLPEGIYVRSYEDRTDLFSFLIIGPTGTPYEGVPFFFDVRLPPDTYPEKPPQVVYIPYSAEKLNPNLYPCGKVCTSLLGTWNGEGVETWNPKDSNLFQVILSIQALILVREPYFNEAGYESRKDLPESGPNSKRYNETAAVNALEYLWKVVRKPPPPFEDIIKQHIISIWPNLREKLLRLSKDENSMPDYPVFGSKGFRLAIEKAVHRIDGCVEYNYDQKVGTDKDDYDIWGEGDEMDLRDEEEEDEKVWPPTDRVCDRENEDDVFNRAGGTVDFLSGNDKYSHRLTYEYTEPVTCFLLRKQ